MNIAMIHFRVGATDGVSLEMDKWKDNLEKLGHHVIYIAGEAHLEEAFVIDEMSISKEKHKHLFHNCYESLDDYENGQALIDDVYNEAKIIKDKLVKIIEEQKIDLIIPNNVSSLGLNLGVGIAISDLIEETKIKVVYHHHDFYWERDRYAHPTTPKINEILNTYFPNTKLNATHCVINKIAQKEMKERKQIEAIVVPNVFDFSQPLWEIDEYNHDLRKNLNIKENDIVFLQATRIEDRKAIELAMDTIESVNQKLSTYIGKKLYNKKQVDESTKIHLLMPGLNELRRDKLDNLLSKTKKASYDIHFINDKVESKRNKKNNQKIYALWDIYPHADFVTYPSILEGWGNQFIEAMFAKKPILIYEYPVYLTDIKPLNFKVVSLGGTYALNRDYQVTVDQKIIEAASKQILDILFDEKMYQNLTEHNFEIASDKLSYERLRKDLKNIISNNI